MYLGGILWWCWCVVNRKPKKGERSQEQSIAKDDSPPVTYSSSSILMPHPKVSRPSLDFSSWASDAQNVSCFLLGTFIVQTLSPDYNRCQGYLKAVLRELNVQKQRDKIVFLGITVILKSSEEGSRRGCSDVPGKEKWNRFHGWTGGRWGWEQEQSGVCTGKSIERDDRKTGASVSEVET